MKPGGARLQPTETPDGGSAADHDDDRRPTPAEFGQARRRKEDARLITGRTTLDRQHGAARDAAPGDRPQPARAREDHQRRPSRGQAGARRHRASSPAATSPTRQGPPLRLAGHADMVNPGHPSIAVDEVNHVGEAVAVIVARGRRARTPSSSSTSTTTAAAGPRHGGGGRRGRRPAHDDLASNESFHLVFDAGEAAPASTRTRAGVRRPRRIVVSRRFVQQRLIPAFMEPRSVVVHPPATTTRSGPRPRCRTSCG